MSLIISLGTNLGNRIENIENAKKELCKVLIFEEESRIYTSQAVDYLDQPDFYNQVLQFKEPDCSPQELIEQTLNIESKLGRIRNIDKGPRVIDIDILFWGLEKSSDPSILIPHPRLFERSFICLPLMDLTYYTILKNHYDFSTQFSNEAFPV